MAQAEFDIEIDLTPRVTRQSFLAAYVDEYPLARCRHADEHWTELHSRDVLADEIDEDPS